jgi:hypothetical protein
MHNQTLRAKIKFGLGALALGVALVSVPAFAQDGVTHHHHRHLVAHVRQTPAPQPQPEPAPCIHAQTSCM